MILNNVPNCWKIFEEGDKNGCNVSIDFYSISTCPIIFFHSLDVWSITFLNVCCLTGSRSRFYLLLSNLHSHDQFSCFTLMCIAAWIPLFSIFKMWNDFIDSSVKKVHLIWNIICKATKTYFWKVAWSERLLSFFSLNHKREKCTKHVMKKKKKIHVKCKKKWCLFKLDNCSNKLHKSLDVLEKKLFIMNNFLNTRLS